MGGKVPRAVDGGGVSHPPTPIYQPSYNIRPKYWEGGGKEVGQISYNTSNRFSVSSPEGGMDSLCPAVEKRFIIVLYCKEFSNVINHC